MSFAVKCCSRLGTIIFFYIILPREFYWKIKKLFFPPNYMTFHGNDNKKWVKIIDVNRKLLLMKRHDRRNWRGLLVSPSMIRKFVQIHHVNCDYCVLWFILRCIGLGNSPRRQVSVRGYYWNILPVIFILFYYKRFISLFFWIK